MMDLRDLQTLNELDEEKASEIVSRLLSCWSIPRKKSVETRVDYEFLARNEAYFKTLLHLCGFTLTISNKAGEEDAYLESDTAENQRKFNKQESIVILRLLKFYLESRTKVSLGGGNADITVEDLLSGVNATRKEPMDLKTLLNILNTLDGYNLIAMPGKKSAFDLSTVISIMPGVLDLLPGKKLEAIEETLKAYRNESPKRATSPDGEVQMDLDAEECDADSPNGDDTARSVQGEE